MNILITGSSSGIGYYLANEYLKDNHNVIGISRKHTLLKSKKFISLSADVSNYENFKYEIEKIPFENIDILICCAGIVNPFGDSMSVNPKKWLDCVKTNLVGTFNAIHASFNFIKPINISRNKIFCFAGGGATNSRPKFSAYACSKTGVIRLVEVLSDEWKELGYKIDINAISPGLIKTNMTDEVLKYDISMSNKKEISDAEKADKEKLPILYECLNKLSCLDGLTGKSISSTWDDWKNSNDFGGVLRREIKK